VSCHHRVAAPSLREVPWPIARGTVWR
jgi:hypothetical protein